MMPKMDFDKLFSSFSQIKVAVIGDVMLDTYWWGKVDRISPEAPVPVVAVSKREERIGGAGNVALNIRALGALVSVISVLGKDTEAEQLKALLDSNQINTRYVINSTDRITTNKIRIISRNQQMMRLDAEIIHPLSQKDETALIASIENYIKEERPAVVILEDYNKGVLTEKTIENIISLCKLNKIIIAVDPKRKNFFAYKEVDIFKPNLHEAKEGLNIISDEVTNELLENIHRELTEKLNHRVSLITLSEKGIFFQTGTEQAIIPTHIRSIADVSGAGDTVIAVAAVIFAATGNVQLMAEIANIAGGLVCEEVGTVAIDKDKLLMECKQLLH
jgi:rfaE bifunctional protein kinase chain/domain